MALTVPTMSDLNKIDQSFIQLKNISRIIVQPKETVRLILGDYFRGQLINYNFTICNSNNESISDQMTFNITSPITMRYEINFSQNSEERSLPQTSLIVTDEYDNKYLIFIDFKMYLNIYNITNYYFDNPQLAIINILQKDLYSSGKNLHDDRKCNNLLQLEGVLLFANCKASNGQSVALIINISSPGSPKISYYSNGIVFDEMRDGAIIMLEKMSDFYVMIQKTNTTNCQFSIITMDSSYKITNVLNITQFQDKKDRERTDVVTSRKQKLKFTDKSCGPVGFRDLNQEYLTYLQIQDIQVIDYYPHVVVTSDYNYGILFWNITCTTKTTCTQDSLFRIRYGNVGGIKVLSSDNYNKEKVLFAQVLHPNHILEVNLDSIQSPYISKTYKIQEDFRFFYGNGIIAANTDFIVANLVQIKTQKPLIRIYKRSATFFSSAYTQVSYADFIDSGLFINFIDSNENAFVLKNSDMFRIYKIQDQEFQIMAQNLTHIQEQNYYNTTLIVKLNAKNYSLNSIETVFHINFIKENDQNTYRLYSSTNKDETFTYSYSCGQTDTSIVVDLFYSGSTSTLTVKDVTDDYNQPSKFIRIQKMNIALDEQRSFPVRNCFFNYLVEVSQKFTGTEKKLYMVCAEYQGTNITMTDTVTTDSPEDAIKSVFTLPYANIIEFSYDSSQSSFLILSNKSVDYQDAAIFHIFRVYNVLTWDYTINLNKEFTELADFRFRTLDALTFQSALKQGCFTSQLKYNSDNSLALQTIVLFELNDQVWNQKFRIRNSQTLEFPINSTDQVEINHVKISVQGFVWVLLTNGSMNIYQQIKSQQDSSKLENKYYLKLYRILHVINSIEDKEIINFNIKGNLLLIFSGNSSITIFKFDYTSLKLEKMMMLPLYLTQNSEYYQQYYFVRNQITQKISFGEFNRYLFILFKQEVNYQFDGYKLNIYDIYEYRHNTLIYSYDLSGLLDFNETFIHLQIYELEQDKLLISIVQDDQLLAQFYFTYKTQMKLRTDNLHEFNEQCKFRENSIKLQVYPEESPTEVLGFQITAENSGLIIYGERQNDSLSIEIPHSDDTSLANNDTTGYYLLIENFHGYNMKYDQNCSTTDLFNEICDDVRIYQGGNSYFKSLEFISYANPLSAFFYIDPVLLFFDKNFARVYFPGTQQYYSKYLTDIYKNFLPRQYFFFTLNYDNVQTQYLIVVNETNQFGISRVFNRTSGDKQISSKKQYASFDDQLYIQIARDFHTIPKNISIAELYPKGKYEIIAIFVFDAPLSTTESLIQFYVIDITKEYQTTFKQDLSFQLTADSLNFDTFKVTALSLIAGTSNMVIGIKDYGIMLIDIQTLKIIKKQTLLRQEDFGSLQIDAIIPEQPNNFKLIVAGQGAASLWFFDETFVADGVYKTYFIQTSAKVVSNQVAQDEYGFAYIEVSTEQYDTESYLKYFAYKALNNTKSLGNYSIAYNLDCKFLQTIRYEFARQFFLPTVNNRDMTVALVCDSLLYVIQFNFHPLIEVSIQEEYKQESNSAMLNVTSSNVISKETIQLQVTILNYERPTSPIFYVGFVIMVFVAGGFLSFLREKKQKQESLYKNKKNNRKSNLTSNKESTIYVKRESTFIEEEESILREQSTFSESERSSQNVQTLDNNGFSIN